MGRITVDAEIDWDDEVDVVCTGAGIAGLAIAVLAVDEGADVLIAEPPARVADHRWWPLDCADEPTRAYLAELTADFDATQLDCDEDDLPVRAIVSDRDRNSRTVPPFVGSRMRDWAAQCICSPSGFLYTRVTDWPTATRSLSGGEEWEVAELGTVSVGGGDRVDALHKWLTAEADERDIPRFDVTGLQRLVFDAGMVAGAVFATADGPYSVRSRHGVLICPQAQTSRRETGYVLAGGELRAALVGRAGSRFGRVELLEAPTDDETY